MQKSKPMRSIRGTDEQPRVGSPIIRCQAGESNIVHVHYVVSRFFAVQLMLYGFHESLRVEHQRLAPRDDP